MIGNYAIFTSLMACASDRCSAIDTLKRNHVHNKLIQGPDLAHSIKATVTNLTKNRSDLPDISDLEGEGHKQFSKCVIPIVKYLPHNFKKHIKI